MPLPQSQSLFCVPTLSYFNTLSTPTRLLEQFAPTFITLGIAYTLSFFTPPYIRRPCPRADQLPWCGTFALLRLSFDRPNNKISSGRCCPEPAARKTHLLSAFLSAFYYGCRSSRKAKALTNHKHVHPLLYPLFLWLPPSKAPIYRTRPLYGRQRSHTVLP